MRDRGQSPQWGQFLDVHVPLVDEKQEKPTGRTLTLAENKRGALQRLYIHDMRVAPWADTAHGVMQAVNTYEHHENTVRGGDRAMRNMLRTVTGEFSTTDRHTWSQLKRVLVLL